MTTLIFDMDGTLTEPTAKITTEMMEAIRQIHPSHDLHLVTGSDMDKILRQIPESFLLENFKMVFACNGTRVYNTDLDQDDETGITEPELIQKFDLTDHYSQADLNHLISRLLQIASETHTKCKTGTFIEWRGSQINFSIVGRNCSSGQREDYSKWDKKSGERAKIAEKLRSEFSSWGLGFSLGGQISIDITRKEWDKSFALQFIKTSPEDCHFFGDRIVQGGNDYEIAMKCGRHSSVKGFEETIELLKQFH